MSGLTPSSLITGPVLPAHFLDDTMGALFLGIIISAGLWGTACVQAFHYFSRNTQDPLWTKLMVLIVVALVTVHQAVICHAIYCYLVRWYGQVTYLSVIISTYSVSLGVSAFIELIVQLYFIWRVWRLSGKNVTLAIFLVSQSLGGFAVLMVSAVKYARLPSLYALPSLANLNMSVDALGASCDISISVSLIWLLRRSRPGVAQTDSLVNRLIMFSVNTGLITTVCAFAALVTLAIWPNKYVYVIFFTCVSQLFTNSLLANLNAREVFRRGFGNVKYSSNSFGLSRFSALPGISQPEGTLGPNNDTVAIKSATATRND